MGKRQEEAQKTRQKLIEAIRSLQKEKEYGAIRIEEITERAGVAKGTFYIYFKRKEDLIAAAAYGSYDRFKEIAFAEKGAVAQITSFLRNSAVRIIESSLETAQQWMRSAVSPLENETNGITKLRYDCEFITECIEKAVQTGEMKEDAPAEKLGVQIVSQYYGILSLWCISDGEISLESYMDDFCAQYLPGFLNPYRREN